MIDRRQFHQSVAATAATLALGRPTDPAAAAGPGALPPDPLPPGAAARMGCNRLWHRWPASNPGLNDLTFSPDARYLATLGYQDDHVCIWSVPDGRAVCDWEPQDADRGGTLLWMDRGLYVASGGGLSLWEPLTATLVHRFAGEPAFEPCRGAAVSPDGRLIAATFMVSGSVGLWDTATHRPVGRLAGEIDFEPRDHWDRIDCLLSVAFSRCGRWLAAGGYPSRGVGIEGVVHVWDIAARRHLARFVTRGGPVGRLAFTPNGQLLTAGWTGSVGLWDPIEGRAARDWPHPGAGDVYFGLAVNTAGRIAVQRDDGVRLWDPDPAREALLCRAHGAHLAYSDDGRFVALGRGTGRVDLYDAVTGADLSPPDRHRAHVEDIQLTADGTVCLVRLGYPSPHHVHEVVLRDTRTGARLSATPPADWWPLALASVGTRIAGRLGETRLAVWDWASGAVEVHPEFNARAAAWHPDGETLIVATPDGTVGTWQPTTGRGRRQPVASPAPIRAVAVGADGRAAALSDGGDLFVWHLERDDPPRRLAVPGQLPTAHYCWPVWPLAIAPDGQSVAVTLGDGVVSAGPVTGDELRPVYTHPPGDEGAEDGHNIVPRYTAAGRLLIAGMCTALRENRWSYMGVVADGATGAVVWRSPPQQDWASAWTLSPDGRTLLTGHDDGTLLVWPLDAGPAGA